MEKTGFFRSIKFQIPVLLCAVLLIPLMLLYQANSSLINDITLQNTKASISGDLLGKALSIDGVLNEVTQFAQFQGSGAELLKLISDYYKASGKNKRVARSRLTIELGQRIMYRDVIDRVYLITEGADIIVSTIVGKKEFSVGTPMGAALYADYLEHKNMLAWSPNVRLEDRDTMLYYRPISANGSTPCSLAFEVDTDYLLKMMESKALDRAGMMVCDYLGHIMLEEGTAEIDPTLKSAEFIQRHELLSPIINARDKAGSYLYSYGGEELLVGYYSSTSTSWKYIEVVRVKDIYATERASSIYLAVAITLGILSSVFGFVVISTIILKPMDRVLDAMKRTETGDFVSVNGKLPRNELGVLTTGYNQMTKHLQELIENVYVQELSKREAQLISLQSQMDEHFLYNTLNTVYCVTKRGDTGLASEMLVMLTRFFRLNLSEGRQYLKISEIVELIQCYLWIQKARYGERLRVTLETDERISERYAVKYLFQPIVENAITHGLESKVDAGRVDIKFKCVDDMLYFETCDDGVGIGAEQLEKLRISINEYTRATGESFALKNINEQMRLAYGQQYALRIESTEGIGTRVSFQIPLRTEAPNEK
jgi:sensor histidine kinase YesM